VVRLARQHNLRQREACSVRPKPQHNPLNLLSVVVLALLDPLVLLPEQGLVHLASSSSSSNNNSNHSNHSNSNHSSNRQGPGLVHLVKLNHNNRPVLVLVDSVLHSRHSSSKLVVSSAQGVRLSVKNPPPVDSVCTSHFNFALATDTSQAPQPQVLAVLVPAPGPLVRHSPRPLLPLVLLLNNPRPVRLAPGDLAPVSSKTRYLFLYLMPVFS